MITTVESVWDYPRPPRLEPTSRAIRIVHAGVAIAETARALRILETSHPPVYYIPPADIAMEYLQQSTGKSSYCEFKGRATYWSIHVSPRSPAPDTSSSQDAAWSYEHPAESFRTLRNHLAFYASRVEECYVDGERVAPQPGDFYGGWITSHVAGPFKGAPGTLGW